jgi:hypothetical protein
MELEELEPSKLIGPQQDVETVESWAERNGLTYGTARAWAMKGVVPTVNLGKRRMVNPPCSAPEHRNGASARRAQAASATAQNVKHAGVFEYA